MSAAILDPLQNEIYFIRDGIGLAKLEIDDVKDFVMQDIKKTIQKPACIYESTRLPNTRYYFQYLKSTVFMCVVEMRENKWYLADTQFNPETNMTESILTNDKLLYAK